MGDGDVAAPAVADEPLRHVECTNGSIFELEFLQRPSARPPFQKYGGTVIAPTVDIRQQPSVLLKQTLK